jgi:hypothetical protein
MTLVSIYTLGTPQHGGSHGSKWLAILEKGRCFFGPSTKGLRSYRSLNLLQRNKSILRWATVGGLPLLKVLKTWLTICFQYDMDYYRGASASGWRFYLVTGWKYHPKVMIMDNGAIAEELWLDVMTINRWIVASYCSRWIVITLSHPHLRASRRYQCNINPINIHMCFMEYKYEWINKMQLLSSSFCILIHILKDEGMSFLTFV